MKKKVKWAWEYGCYVPFCPYCDEFAYYKEKCFFCGKEYEWVEPKYKPTVVQVGEYTITQATNNHITITKDDKLVFHASCTKKKTKKELKEFIDYYYKLMEIIPKYESQD